MDKPIPSLDEYELKFLRAIRAGRQFRIADGTQKLTDHFLVVLDGEGFFVLTDNGTSLLDVLDNIRASAGADVLSITIGPEPDAKAPASALAALFA